MKRFIEYIKEDINLEEDKKELLENPSDYYNKKLKDFKTELLDNIKEFFMGKRIIYRRDGRRCLSNEITHVGINSKTEWIKGSTKKVTKYIFLWDGKNSFTGGNYEIYDNKQMKEIDPYGEEEWGIE